MLLISKITKAALNVMPLTLWHWPMNSEMNVGGIAVEAEPSCEYSITFSCQKWQNSDRWQ